MSAPDRIWAGSVDGYGQWWEQPDIVGRTEYIRADLVPQWQSIDTAPKDGSYFLGYWPDPSGGNTDTPVKTWWGPKWNYEKKYGWHNPYEFTFESQDYAPTHWQPLPKPPETP